MAALLLLFTHREGCAERNKIGFCFVFDTGTQSIALGVVMVVDCAAVETGCMLENFIKFATKYVFIFIFWSKCCCYWCAEKNMIGFCFLFDTGTQSIAVWLGTYCCSFSQPQVPPAVLLAVLLLCVSCCQLLQGHPAWSNGAMEHLDQQETPDTARICRFRTTSPVQGVVLASIAE